MVYNIRDHTCVNETGGVCMFRLVNGSCLIGISVLGFLLSSFLIYSIISNRIKLPGRKGIFILNVSFSDLGMSLVGIVRGMGIVSKRFVGVTELFEATNFCYGYTIIINIFTNSLMLVLIPMAFDRFLAVTFPLKYNSFVTYKVSLVMITISWLPSVTAGVLDAIKFLLGTNKMVYQRQYHRCVYENSESYEGILFLLAPLVVLSILYILIIVAIIKNKIKFTKVIITTTTIILTGMIVCIPEVLMATFYINMSYEVAQIFTVTLYYTNSVFNPVIYFCVNPRVSEQISVSRAVKRTFSHTASSDNFNASKLLRTFSRKETDTSKALEEFKGSPCLSGTSETIR